MLTKISLRNYFQHTNFLFAALEEKLWRILCAQFYQKLVHEAPIYVCHYDLAIIMTTMECVLP